MDGEAATGADIKVVDTREDRVVTCEERNAACTRRVVEGDSLAGDSAIQTGVGAGGQRGVPDRLAGTLIHTPRHQPLRWALRDRPAALRAPGRRSPDHVCGIDP